MPPPRLPCMLSILLHPPTEAVRLLLWLTTIIPLASISSHTLTELWVQLVVLVSTPKHISDTDFVWKGHPVHTSEEFPSTFSKLQQTADWDTILIHLTMLLNIRLRSTDMFSKAICPPLTLACLLLVILDFWDSIDKCKISVLCRENVLHKLSNNCCYEIISSFFIG